jgi:23S rRNA (adenine2030-N6)-methyltransferase
MNYRHGFHAGNFADVFKHAMLARILVYLMKKDAPLRYIDTHAGAGRYDLASDAAKRSPEWRDGVARLLKARPPREIRDLLQPYLDAIGPFDEAEGRPLSYPGSPALAQALLRPQDRIALCEAHPEEREALIAALGRDARLSIVGTDGYIALNAYVPPKERRGLVLIDPPYEEGDEAKRVETALSRALSKWPRGTYVLWRPIKDERDDAHFRNAIAAIGAPNMLRLEIDVGEIAPGPHSPAPLRRTGLIVVNPPFGLIDEARALMPWLTKLLTRGGKGAHVVEWLTPPA